MKQVKEQAKGQRTVWSNCKQTMILHLLYCERLLHAYGKANKTGQVKVCVRECLKDKDMESKFYCMFCI